MGVTPSLLTYRCLFLLHHLLAPVLILKVRFLHVLVAQLALCRLGAFIPPTFKNPLGVFDRATDPPSDPVPSNHSPSCCVSL